MKMADKEARKSDYTGDVFGDWTVLRKAPPAGDRIRRWIVGNDEGVEMDVEQTGLKDLALAKRLKDSAEAKAKPLSRQIAENVLAANDLYREAVASVALDNDPECGTYTLDELNPFADMTPEVVEFEDVVVESDNPFDAECVECGEELEPLVSGEGLSATNATVELVFETLEDAQRPQITAALDAVIKAKAALNAAAKALESLLK